MKKGAGEFKFFAVVFFLIVVALSVFAQNVQDSESIEENGVSNETGAFIKDFVQEEGISENQIDSIDKIDLENPPENVKVGEEIEDANIAVFDVKYTKNEEPKQLFVITYSTEEFKTPLELRTASAIEYLSFGETGEFNSSEFLKTASGVRSSLEKGYVMIDYGSITGLSTNLEISDLTDENVRVEIIVYKNGENTGLSNLIVAGKNGIENDFDKQSKGIVRFGPGDVISLKLEINGNARWTDVTSLVKVELEE